MTSKSHVKFSRQFLTSRHNPCCVPLFLKVAGNPGVFLIDKRLGPCVCSTSKFSRQLTSSSHVKISCDICSVLCWLPHCVWQSMENPQFHLFHSRCVTHCVSEWRWRRCISATQRTTRHAKVHSVPIATATQCVTHPVRLANVDFDSDATRDAPRVKQAPHSINPNICAASHVVTRGRDSRATPASPSL